MFVPVRCEQHCQRVRFRMPGFPDEGPDAHTDRTVRGFAGREAGQRLPVEPLCEEFELGRGSCPVEAFYHYEILQYFAGLCHMSPFFSFFASGTVFVR